LLCVRPRVRLPPSPRVRLRSTARLPSTSRPPPTFVRFCHTSSASWNPTPLHLPSRRSLHLLLHASPSFLCSISPRLLRIAKSYTFASTSAVQPPPPPPAIEIVSPCHRDDDDILRKSLLPPRPSNRTAIDVVSATPDRHQRLPPSPHTASHTTPPPSCATDVQSLDPPSLCVARFSPHFFVWPHAPSPFKP
jgi:hypothetical protein